MLHRLFPIIAVIAFTASASAQVSLKLRYSEGTKFTLQTEAKASHTLNVRGKDNDGSTTSFIVSTRSIGKRGADGSIKIEEKVNSLQTETTFPDGTKLAFDSANPDKAAPKPQLEQSLEFSRAISRLPIIVELDSHDKITSVKLPDGEYEKLPEGIKSQLSSETMMKQKEQAGDFLPDGPVKKGDTWERSSENNLGNGQLLKFRTRFEYAGTVEKAGASLDKITGKVFEVSYTITDNPVVQVTKSNLKVTESESTFLFNREGGYLVSKVSKVKINGLFTLVANNMEQEAKLDMRFEENVTRQK